MLATALVLSLGTATHLYEAPGKAMAPIAFHEEPGSPVIDSVRVLQDAADDLEFVVVVLACHEAMLDLGIVRAADALARSEEIMGAADALAGMDVLQVFSRLSDRLPPLGQPLREDARATLSREQLVRVAQARLDLWPYREAEEMAKGAQKEALVHRCRTALEWLESFVRRNRFPAGEVTRVAGRAYAEGRLRLNEVAALLGCAPTDAIALLEEHGFCRAPERVGLSSGQRATMFAELDADRRRRGGEPHLDNDLGQRDVLASQRIEGVDARPWIPAR